MFSSPDRKLTIIFLILFFTISPIPNGVAAQSGMNADPSFSVCMAVILVFMGLFIASFSIYIRYCSSRQSSANSGILSSAQANVAAGGLDQLTIETFPTFTYAEVKVHKIRNEDLECAVCLTEFEDTETLRLIPKCDHVFHPECIDAWLESHVTCPVCRAILDMDSVTDQVPDETTVQVQTADETVVQVVCENPQVIAPIREQNRLPRNGSIKRSRGVLGLGRFRSNSTGHSDVNVERFTLQLPEESRKEIMDRALLNRAKSCTARNGSTAKGSKTGSSKSGRLYKRMGSLDHSKSSPFLLRTLSMISRDNNNSEGSSSKGLKSTVMIPSIKCFDPKPTNEFNNVMVDPV